MFLNDAGSFLRGMLVLVSSKRFEKYNVKIFYDPFERDYVLIILDKTGNLIVEQHRYTTIKFVKEAAQNFLKNKYKSKQLTTLHKFLNLFKK
jgi:hypothetical protein